MSGPRRRPAPLRRLAFSALLRIDQQGAFSSYLSNSAEFKKLAGLDRNLALELVFGTLRRQGTLDRILREYRQDLGALDPGVRLLLRLGAYQLLFLDRIPAYAVLWESVELCRELVGFAPAGLLNAVLRRLQREQAAWHRWLAEFPESGEEQAAWLSLPEWLWKKWVSRIGLAMARRWAEAAALPPRIDFRRPFNGQSRQALAPLPETAIPVRQAEWPPGAGTFLGRPGHEPTVEAGQPVYLQSLASQCIGWLLPVAPGDRILDLCAAPGGKTLILAERTGITGQVIAMDRHRSRFNFLRNKLNQLQVENTLCVVGDSAGPLPFARAWSRMLLDAPCSGLGTLRGNPEIRWRIQQQDLLKMRELQLNLLRNAADHLAERGRLLYSTCSTEQEENQEVVGTFLAERQDFQHEKLPADSGAGAFVGPEGFFSTFPEHPDEDGFFAALLARKGG